MKRSHPKAGRTVESWRDVLPLQALPMLLSAAVYARAAGNGFALPPSSRRVAAVSLLARYLKVYVWPACLSSDYSDGSFTLPVSLADPWSLLSAAAVLLFAALAVALARGLETVAFGLIAFASFY